jgi:hypothetical protein
VVVQDPEVRAQLRQAAFGQEKIAGRLSLNDLAYAGRFGEPFHLNPLAP